MSDNIKPCSYPEQAAFQLILELIRAEKVPMHSDNVNGLMKMYDQARNHFKESRD